jgi:rubredoxin
MRNVLQPRKQVLGLRMQHKQHETGSSLSEHDGSEFRCKGCGYQIAIAEPHPVCPMCGLGSWAPITTARELAHAGDRQER